MSFLDEQIKNKSLASAYIFEGKNPDYNKTFALQFARKVFESYGIDQENETNPDLYLIDKEGSVIDIESIREMLKNIYLRPENSKIKIYIIHQAQDLRQEGANAMLKSLEELKSYVKLIFTCVNKDTILPTIRSRCQTLTIQADEPALDIDMDYLYDIWSDLYKGKIESFYKNKEFFDKYKEDRQTIYLAIEKLYQNLIKYKFSKNELDLATSYMMKKFPLISLDKIERSIDLVEKIRNASKTNINYDLSIEKIVFDVFREGKCWLKVVGIRFRQAGKIYYFNAKNIEFEYKDLAVVETSNGIEIAEVALTDVDLEKNQLKEKLSEIIRKATKDDIYYYKKNEKEAKEAIGLCQQKACEHGLSMKIVDAKYTFDRSKITFYFKSENRVDFRGLVKDLAAIYKNRIELRQIGVRDHAKMIEHFGPCGQRCCCGRFLNDFKPLSIKMAKDQNITLDPAKISGICGRLMCCLSYEEECYKCAKKIMPKEGQKVKTADGYGMVLENDYVKESSRVRVKLTGTDEEIEESYLLKEMEY